MTINVFFLYLFIYLKLLVKCGQCRQQTEGGGGTLVLTLSENKTPHVEHAFRVFVTDWIPLKSTSRS